MRARGGESMSVSLTALAAGFAMDLLLGDPPGFPHPVRLMGALIERGERVLRRLFPKTPKGELLAGAVLAVAMAAGGWTAALVLLRLLSRLHPWLATGAEAVMCWQILAVKSLKDESMRVHRALVAGDLEAARRALSMIVGRDTRRLDEQGIVRAAVETVAENTSDGVVAPMLWVALGGVPAGFLYKAVSTMDSMIGYKNDRYLYFGRAAARLDDALGFLPARISGLLMAAAAFALRLDARGAVRIFLRDRKKHQSPNSAHTEAACAGALGIALGGDACYAGRLQSKPAIGDALRPADPEDIRRANVLLYAVAALCFVVCLALRAALGP